MSVYLYSPPTWRHVQVMEGALRYGVATSTLVYRLGGVWYNQELAGIDQPVVDDCDTDAASGLRLFFTHPIVVPGSLYDALSVLQPANPSWTPGTLTLL